MLDNSQLYHVVTYLLTAKDLLWVLLAFLARPAFATVRSQRNSIGTRMAPVEPREKFCFYGEDSWS